MNERALRDILPDAQLLLELHAEAISKLSLATEKSDDQTDMAVLLNAAHCFNLYDSLLHLVTGGRFDVATYLVRPLWDSAAFLGASGSSETAATEFLSGRLRAGDARKLIVGEVRAASPSSAAALEEGYRSDYRAIQSLAHAGALQSDKLLSGSPDALMVNLRGRQDARQARLMMRATLRCELDVHANLFAFRGKVLGDSWRERSDEVTVRVADWITDGPDGETTL